MKRLYFGIDYTGGLQASVPKGFIEIRNGFRRIEKEGRISFVTEGFVISGRVNNQDIDLDQKFEFIEDAIRAANDWWAMQ